MAWLAVDPNGDEFLFLKKPERIVHYNVFRPSEVEFRIWASSGGCIDLPKGSIKQLVRRVITWDDEPIEI